MAQRKKRGNKGGFHAPYSFEGNGEVCVRGKHGKHLRVIPKKLNDANGSGGQGKFARWTADPGDDNTIRLQSKHTGKYLRIKKDGRDVDVGGTGGKWTVFKIHECQANVIKLESKELEGKYIAINPKHQVIVGGGGKHCELTFLAKGGQKPKKNKPKPIPKSDDNSTQEQDNDDSNSSEEEEDSESDDNNDESKEEETKEEETNEPTEPTEAADAPDAPESDEKENDNLKEECNQLIECIEHSGKGSKNKERDSKMTELIKLSTVRPRNERIKIVSYYSELLNDESRRFLGDIWNNNYFKEGNKDFRMLLQGCWISFEEWIVSYLLERFSKDEGDMKKLIKDKEGCWLDILCMLNNEQLTKVSSLLGTKDSQSRELCPFFGSCMDIADIDNDSSFRLLIKQLTLPQSNDEIEKLTNDENTINQITSKLVILYLKKDKNELKNEWINVICNYRYCDSGKILASIINGFKEQSELDKDFSKYLKNKFDNTGEALAAIVEYHVNNASQFLANKLYDATHGLGTNEDLLMISAMFTAESDNTTEVKQAFYTAQDETLQNNIESEHENEWFKKLLLAILKCEY